MDDFLELIAEFLREAGLSAVVKMGTHIILHRGIHYCGTVFVIDTTLYHRCFGVEFRWDIQDPSFDPQKIINLVK